MPTESSPFAVRTDAETLHAFHAELAPEGILEETFALEIVGAARSLSHLVLRRSIAELRILQTERQIRVQLFPDGVPDLGLGVMDLRKAVQQTSAFAAAPLDTEDYATQ